MQKSIAFGTFTQRIWMYVNMNDWMKYECVYVLVNNKEIVQLKMKILSLYAHPQFVLNVHETLSPVQHKGRYKECW